MIGFSHGFPGKEHIHDASSVTAKIRVLLRRAVTKFGVSLLGIIRSVERGRGRGTQRGAGEERGFQEDGLWQDFRG